MKYLSIMLAACLLLFASCGTTYTTTTAYPAYDVPTTVRTSFNTQYPGATAVTWMNPAEVPFTVDREFVDWPLTTNDYVVRFDMTGNTYYGWYDANGIWVGTANEINNFSTLPQAVHNTVNREYPGYVIQDVNRTWRGANSAYVVELKSGNIMVDLYVDQNGNVMRRRVDTRY